VNDFTSFRGFILISDPETTPFSPATLTAGLIPHAYNVRPGRNHLAQQLQPTRLHNVSENPGSNGSRAISAYFVHKAGLPHTTRILLKHSRTATFITETKIYFLTAVGIKICIFWDTGQRGPWKLNGRFGGTRRLHLERVEEAKQSTSPK
jgi:hypothetical protein